LTTLFIKQNEKTNMIYTPVCQAASSIQHCATPTHHVFSIQLISRAPAMSWPPMLSTHTH